MALESKIKELEEKIAKLEECMIDDKFSFLEIGTKYQIRTVTMIYTALLVDMNKYELLLDKCCWIPETLRWHKSCKTGEYKEVEPYCNKVILFKGAILDITPVSNLPSEPK